MSLSALFPQLQGFRLIRLIRETGQIVLVCERVTVQERCPCCHVAAHRVHSRYQRTVKDLPFQQAETTLQLHVRKFYCDNQACHRRVFTERLPHLVAPHGRFTFALHHILGQLGQEHGGTAGARSAKIFGCQVSGRTILRRLHACPLPLIPTSPHIIGVDDWAWKRRQRYGALIVDLENRRPIALLPERSQSTVAAWLQLYPSIEVVARDRSFEFAAAISQALPHAQQVADRWHLAKNLTECLLHVLNKRWRTLRNTFHPPVSDLSAHVHLETIQGDSPSVDSNAERYALVQALRASGLAPTAIAQQLQVNRGTIHRWLKRGYGAHMAQRQPRTNILDRILPYLQQRWEEGERNGDSLWRELLDQGHRISRSSVFRRLALWRERPPPSVRMPLPPRSPLDGITPRKVLGWILAPSMRADEEAQLAQILEADAVIHQATRLYRQWMEMIRQHTAAPLDDWLKECHQFPLEGLRNFARGITRDKAAIVAGLSMSYSTGPVEGHIHRLKLIKRQAYGRASLAYLQRRILRPS